MENKLQKNHRHIRFAHTQTVRYILVIWQVYMFLLISTCAISA